MFAYIYTLLTSKDNVQSAGDKNNNNATTSSEGSIQRKHVSLVVLLLTVVSWILCSSVTQVSNTQALRGGCLPITLVTTQMLFGILIHFIMKFAGANKDENDKADAPTISIKETRKWRVAVGLCNFLSHLLTMYAMQMLTPALTHTIRSAETLWMILFGYYMLAIKPSFTKVISSILMIAGVISIACENQKQDNTTNGLFIKGVFTTLAANLAFTLRYYCLERYTLLTSRQLLYPEICIYSFGWTTFYVFGQYVVQPALFTLNPGDIFTYVCISAICHVVANSMYVYALSFAAPNSHSVFRLVNRTVVVFSLVFVYGFERKLSHQMMAGVILCSIGGLLYVLPAYQNKVRKNKTLQKIATILLLFFVMATIKYRNDELRIANELQLEPLQEIGFKEENLHRLVIEHNKNNELKIVNKLKIEALQEIGFKEENLTRPNFDHPVIPVSGYRSCLRKSIHRKTGLTVYTMGNSKTILDKHQATCKDCLVVALNASETFSTLSSLVCTSNSLYCGVDSSFLCGLLGMSTKTITHVDQHELNTWPHYMLDYSYGNDSISERESNHRLAFDRHTIKEHQKARLLLKSPQYSHKTYKKGFNLYLWTTGSKCTHAKTDRHRPLASGNMGDIYGSDLAEYIKIKTGLKYYITCFGKNSNNKEEFDVTLALVGSLASMATKKHNPVVIGMGIMMDVSIEKGKKVLRKDASVFSVRGPLTRDQFLLHHGKNPEIIGDPGIHFYEVFKTKVEKVRKDNHHKMIDLCFVSHSADDRFFTEHLHEFRDVTTSAVGKTIAKVEFLALCRAVVSSSLHGVIFAHSLSIPAFPLKVSDNISGGDWKYMDYYYGINVTTFTGRLDFTKFKKRLSKKDWIDVVNKFPQPEFPLKTDITKLLERVKSLFEQ